MFLLHKGPALDGLIRKIQASNILSEAESGNLFAWHAQVAAVYPRHEPAEMVSSHNDLFKPDNILFDGDRVWLVDWEAAFLNDRYADLATVANLLVTDDAEEMVYLQEYFGQPPDEYQRARFFLMEQLVHMFYAMVFLCLSSSTEPKSQNDKPPELQGFPRRMWAGKVNLKENATKIVYGKVHWEQLVHNTRQTRFNEALRIVSNRHPRS